MHTLACYIIMVVLVSATRGSRHSVPNPSNQVKFIVYVDPEHSEEVKFDSLASINTLKINESTFVIIDGFLSTLNGAMTQSVKNGVLKNRKNSNVIVVDWSSLSGSSILELNENQDFLQILQVYNTVKSEVKHVGEQLATFLALLYTYSSVNFSTLHLIGYSLGAHVAGIAGLRTLKNFNRRIARITALDPAGPGFPIQNARNRLDKSDAEFVDVYYTNRYLSGDMEHAVGHADIFVNGGKSQPGCDSASLMNSTMCNHAFSWKVWNMCLDTSCLACPCHASECEDCIGICTNGVVVGGDISLDTRGDFYLKTGPL